MVKEEDGNVSFEDSEPPRKRQRAAIACHACRASRCRCIRLNDTTCILCQENDIVCSLSLPPDVVTNAPAAIGPKGYLTSIDVRLDKLERGIMKIIQEKRSSLPSLDTGDILLELPKPQLSSSSSSPSSSIYSISPITPHSPMATCASHTLPPIYDKTVDAEVAPDYPLLPTAGQERQQSSPPRIKIEKLIDTQWQRRDLPSWMNVGHQNAR